LPALASFPKTPDSTRWEPLRDDIDVIVKRKYGDSVVRWVVANYDWSYTRHPVTGLVLRRELMLYVGVRNATGCMLLAPHVVQERVGDDWSRFRFHVNENLEGGLVVSIGDGFRRIECDALADTTQ
jgi:hypothetical protein